MKTLKTVLLFLLTTPLFAHEFNLGDLNEQLAHAKSYKDSIQIYYDYGIDFCDHDLRGVQNIGTKIIEVSSTNDYSFGLALGYNLMGVCSLEHSKYKTANTWFHKSSEICAANNFKELSTEVYYNLGMSYYERSDYSNAIKNYGIALEQGNANRSEAFLLSKLGQVFYDLKEFERARSYFIKSQDIHEKNKDYSEFGFTSSYLAKTYLKTKETSKALDVLFKAKKVLVNKNLEAGKTLNNLAFGDVYLFLEKKDKAAFYYNQAEKTVSNEYSPKLKLSVQLALAKFNFQEHKLNESLVYALEAYRIANEIKSSTSISESSLILSDIYYGRKDYKAALNYLNIEIVYLDSTNKNKADKALFDEQRKLEMNELIVKEENEYAQLLSARNLRFWTVGFITGILVIAVLYYQQSKIKKAWRALEVSEKARSRFLTSMSHEIRTPLNAIIGYTSLLSNTKLNNDQYNFAHTINHSGNTLFKLTNQLFEMDYLNNNSVSIIKKWCTINDILHPISTIFETKVKAAKLDFNIENNAVGARIFTNKKKVQQILIILFDNGLKFTEKGNIVLRIDELKTETESKIKFSLIDSGKGIPEEHRAHIFKQFYQIESVYTRQYGGIGLGLSIAQKKARNLGTKIKVKSTFNSGSTFSFEIESPLIDIINGT